jgi:hypothetical protein
MESIRIGGNGYNALPVFKAYPYGKNVDMSLYEKPLEFSNENLLKLQLSNPYFNFPNCLAVGKKYKTDQVY